jgi:hypothetical protein
MFPEQTAFSGYSMVWRKNSRFFSYKDRDIIINRNASRKDDSEGTLPQKSVYSLELDGVYVILMALSPHQKNLEDIPNGCNS